MNLQSLIDSPAGRFGPAPDADAPALGALKIRQQAAWTSGDYAVVGTTLQIVGERLAEAVDLRAGEHVIDIAAGNGNASLAAARRYAHVVSTDYVPHLLDKGAVRAQAEGLAIEFRQADAEALPFQDATFDVALSTFGAMFAPDHGQTAREMLRVVRPGGRIGLANWTPDGFIGQLFRLIGQYVPPPSGVPSPALWGTEPHIVELFGTHASGIVCRRCLFNFRYRSPAHWLEVFRAYYGPVLKAYGALAPERQATLSTDILALLQAFNTGGTHALVVPGEYLEVVVTRQ